MGEDQVFHIRHQRSGTLQSGVDPLSQPSQPSASTQQPEEEVKASSSSSYTGAHGEQVAAAPLLAAMSQPAAAQSDDEYSLDDDDLDDDERDESTRVNPVALTDEKQAQQGNGISKVSSRRSSIQSMKQNFSKKKPALMILRVYIQTFVAFLAFLSIYWGSFWGRSTKWANLKFLVVVDDIEVDGIPPYFGQTVNNTLENLSGYGDYEIYAGINGEKFMQLANKHSDGNTTAEFYRQIHHQNYWGGIYVRENATYDLYEAMIAADASAFNTTTVMEVVYEGGRDALGMTAYIEPNLNAAKRAILETVSDGIYQPMMDYNLTSSERVAVLQNATSLLTAKSYITNVDHRPISTSASVGPVLIGLTYALVLCFHQFNFAARIHAELIVKLKPKSFLVFRLFSSQVTYLFLSLLYSLMAVAFQVPMGETFGKSGFLVFWATVFLYQSALGGIVENIAIFIVSRNRLYVGFLVVSLIVLNLSVTMYPLALCPHFYRYGYAMPMNAAHSILSVVAYNTWKGNLGRNYAVLVAWIVVTNIALPFSIRAGQRHVAKVAAKTAAKATNTTK